VNTSPVRIKALQRAQVPDFELARGEDSIAFGHFRLSAAQRFLEKDGVRLKLGSRALDILITLVERAPEVVTKRELLARVWPDLVVDEGSLRFHIAALRKVLGDRQSGTRYVINVPGRGYCFSTTILRSAASLATAERLQSERVATRPGETHNAGAMGELAGDIAHDFNNILGAILGYGELAQSSASAGEQMRHYVDNIMIAGRRAKSLVERLLASTRSGLDERTPIHVQSVVAEALDLISGSLPAGVRLEGNLHAGDAAVLGDPTQIHRVVMNLCTNAIHAMKYGGDLVVSLDPVMFAESRAFTTGTLSPGKYIRLVVRDSGVGIVPAVLERIFEPFFTTKQVGAGTGLGLSLVHGIVSDLGGAVNVESDPGRGSAFTVCLPSHGRLSQTFPAVEELPRGAGQAILLVDDQEPLVCVGQEMLAELGYEPVGFTSGMSALAAFRENPQHFAAVLSDETMPELTGSQLAREVRKLHVDIPIILMSGYGGTALAAPALAAGANVVLGKPLVARDIARCLASVIPTVKGW
jgi:signal transduction histidine kinase/CheY-like chemotaxis protein